MAVSRRRKAAQRRAREALATARRRETRSKVLLHSGIIVGVLAAITVVVLVLTSGITTNVVSPRNLASDGIVVGEGYRAQRTPALAADRDPVPTATDNDGKTVAIRLYVDYLCPNCRAFDDENGDYLSKLVDSGAATLEFHPVAILDRMSQGTKYSTRSAAAAVCVADLAPDSFFSVHDALIGAQPSEQSTGLTNAELASVVTSVKGLRQKAEVADCIDDQRFAPWITAATKRAAAGHFKGTDVTSFPGTPTVIVDGKLWKGEQPFTEFVTAALGESTTH